MARSAVPTLIVAELAHIPIGPGEHQGLLRAIYRQLRGNGIGAKGAESAGQVLARSVELIRRDFPTAEFEYDRAFFNG
jgi:hypothetical protein